MTTPIANVDNTTLNNLTPNLDIGDVADPALRLVAFQYIYTEMQTIITAYNAFIAAGGIATGNLADLSVTTAKLADLAVTTGKIPDLAIVTAKINDLAVTAGKIAVGTITSTQIADLGIATGDLADAIITTIKLADLNVTTGKLADASVTLAKMAAASVGTSQLVDGSVTGAKIAPATLTADKFVAGALNNDTQNGLLITALTANIKKREVYPEDYGALTGIANATVTRQAIIAAITYANSIGGKVKFGAFAAGDYYVDQKIDCTDLNVFVEGTNGTGSTGRGTKIYTTSLSDDVFYIEAVTQSIQGVVFRDIQIMGNKALGSSGSGIKMVANTAGKTISAIVIENVEIDNCKDHGLYMTATSFIFNGYIANLRTSGNGGRGHFGEFQVQQMVIINNQNLSAGLENMAYVGDTVNGYKPTEITLIRPVVDTSGSTYYGCRFTYCSNIVINELHTENQTTGQILLESCSTVTVQGGGIRQTGTAKGIVISNLSGKTTNLIKINSPGWTNTSTQKRVEVLLPSSSTFGNFEFGFHADGIFSPTDITGYATLFLSPAQSIFFVKNPSYTATYDPPSIANGAAISTTVAVDRAALGNFVSASFSLNLAGLALTAFVSAVGVVTCLFVNNTGGAIDLASGTLTVRLHLR